MGNPLTARRQRARSFKFFLYVFPTALVTIFFYFFALDSRSPGLLIGSLICASGLCEFFTRANPSRPPPGLG